MVRWGPRARGLNDSFPWATGSQQLVNPGARLGAGLRKNGQFLSRTSSALCRSELSRGAGEGEPRAPQVHTRLTPQAPPAEVAEGVGWVWNDAGAPPGMRRALSPPPLLVPVEKMYRGGELRSNLSSPVGLLRDLGNDSPSASHHPPADGRTGTMMPASGSCWEQ